MKISDFQAFNYVPYYFWVKDPDGVYLWGNQRMCEYAGCELAGKTDYDISSSEVAESLTENDRLVLEKSGSQTFYEQVDTPEGGKVTLSVCKYPEQLDGKTCVFGISFAVE